MQIMDIDHSVYGTLNMLYLVMLYVV